MQATYRYHFCSYFCFVQKKMVSHLSHGHELCFVLHLYVSMCIAACQRYLMFLPFILILSVRNKTWSNEETLFQPIMQTFILFRLRPRKEKLEKRMFLGLRQHFKFPFHNSEHDCNEKSRHLCILFDVVSVKQSFSLFFVSV